MGQRNENFHCPFQVFPFSRFCRFQGDWQHMQSGSSHVRITKRARQRPADKWVVSPIRRSTDARAAKKGDETMEPQTSSSRIDATQPRSLSELLECPPAVGVLLNNAASCLSYDSGDVVFLQSGNCEGLYVVISGQFLRKTERMQARLTLAPARPGDLVELAAALGDGHHTYTMTAQIPGSVLLLPIEALRTAFLTHPPLRMRLLEELAREVSRAYDACCISRSVKTRRRGAQAASA
jgi:hypothetical protein